MKKPSLRTAVIPHITAVLLYVLEASFLLLKKKCEDAQLAEIL